VEKSHQFRVNYEQFCFWSKRPMRGPKPLPIDLTPRQQTVLEQLSRRRAARAHLVLRARLLLLAAAGSSNSQLSRHLGLDRGQVRLWRARWHAAQAELVAVEAADPDDRMLTSAIETLLADAPRPGTPPTFTPEQVVQIIALACEQPDQATRPVSHWTAREVADEAVQRGIVDRISARSVGRFLKRGRSPAAS
jgi:transposase